MKKLLFKILFLLTIVSGSNYRYAYAQYVENADIAAAVHHDLNAFLNSDSFKKFQSKHYPESQGTITMDLVVTGKKVESIFVSDAAIEPVRFINAFCNFIKDMTFDFKLSKGQRMKISHTFNIHLTN